jgi:maltoporin
MVKDIEGLVEDFLKNSNNKSSSQEVITLYNNQPSGDGLISRPVVRLYLEDKYAEFFEEYTQIANSIEELKPIIEYIDHNGFATNLD